MKKAKKNLLLSLGIFAGFLLPFVSSAMTPYAQLNSSTLLNRAGLGNYPAACTNHIPEQYLGTGLSGTLSSIDLRFDGTVPNIYFFEADTKADLLNQNGTAHVINSAFPGPFTGNGQNSDKNIAGSNWGSPVFNSSKYYGLIYNNSNSGGFSDNNYGLSATSTDASFTNQDWGLGHWGAIGCSSISNGGVIDTTSTVMSNIYFRLNGITGPDITVPGPNLTYTDPIASSTLQALPGTSSFKYAFKYDFTNFSTSSDGTYLATAHYSTPNLPVLYDLESSSFTFDSGVATGTAAVLIPDTLFLPEFGTSTPWSTYTDLFFRSNGSSTLVYTTPTINFYVSQPFPTSSAYISGVYVSKNGFRVDNNNCIIDSYGRFLDVNGDATSTCVLYTAALPKAAIDDCSSDYNVPLFASGTMRMISCSVQAAGKNILSWLFTPPPQVIDDFTSTIKGLGTIFPFNIFTSLSDVVNGVLNGDGSYTVRPVGKDPMSDPKYDQLVFLQNTAVLGNNGIVIMTSSSLESVVGKEAKDQIFLIIRYALRILLFTFVIALIWIKTRKH